MSLHKGMYGGGSWIYLSLWSLSSSLVPSGLFDLKYSIFRENNVVRGSCPRCCTFAFPLL